MPRSLALKQSPLPLWESQWSMLPSLQPLVRQTSLRRRLALPREYQPFPLASQRGRWLARRSLLLVPGWLPALLFRPLSLLLRLVLRRECQRLTSACFLRPLGHLGQRPAAVHLQPVVGLAAHSVRMLQPEPDFQPHPTARELAPEFPPLSASCHPDSSNQP